MMFWKLAACLVTVLCGCARTPNREATPVEPEPASADSAEMMAPGPVLSLEGGQDGEILPLAVSLPVEGPSLPMDKASLLVEADRLQGAGQLDEALSILDTLLVLEPDSVDLLERRAAVLTSVGRSEDAADDLRRCCALHQPSCCSP